MRCGKFGSWRGGILDWEAVAGGRWEFGAFARNKLKFDISSRRYMVAVQDDKER